MGIDKQDVDSVIHYDMPKSIENYIQEIGRAGRRGTLAQCHLFLNDHNYYGLRQMALGNLIDKSVCINLLDKIRDKTFEALNDYKPFDSRHDKIEFGDKYDANLTTKELILKEPTYAYLPLTDIKVDIDLKPEAVTTLLYHLETDYYDDNGPMMVFHGTFYQNALLRFYTDVEENKSKYEFIRQALESAYQSNGVYRINIPKLA